ncbi:DNA-binding SAP [Penicillium concentricum]|uniref:DNA-binding SAP n=1 Tax=Penicillium concentricum TaxID=293559 RepID=A0A9W9S777_9EURO|nr:DNA-binding SAP [Penicillium concentricum]KAJ5373351.1 DNA-binding SAP [Penicillium concentricum]
MRLSAALYSPTPWLACLKSAQLQRIARATGIQSSGTKGVLIERIAAELTLHSQSQAQLELQLSAAADGVAEGVTSIPNHSTTASDSTSISPDREIDRRSVLTKSRASKAKTKTKSVDLSKSNPAKQPWSILSIDMGIQNLAFAHLLVPRPDSPGVGIDTAHPRAPVLTAWHRVAISEISSLNLIPGDNTGLVKPAVSISGSEDATESSQAILPIKSEKDIPVKIAKSAKEENLYCPDIYAANAYTLITSLIAAYRPTHVLIERQRFRSGGGSAVLEWTLRVGIMEGMLYAVLHTLRQERGGDVADLIVRGVEPSRVVRYWLEGGSGSSVPGKGKVGEKSEVGGKTKEKKPNAREVKKAKIDIVGRWLSAAMQDTNACPDTDDGPKKLELGIAADNKIVLADKSVSPALHGVAGAYMRKWQGQTQTKKGRGKGSRSPSPISPQSDIGDEVVAVDPKKLDDLADCLLQGVTWVEWQIMRERVAKEGVGALDSIL